LSRRLPLTVLDQRLRKEAIGSKANQHSDFSSNSDIKFH